MFFPQTNDLVTAASIVGHMGHTATAVVHMGYTLNLLIRYENILQHPCVRCITSLRPSGRESRLPHGLAPCAARCPRGGKSLI